MRFLQGPLDWSEWSMVGEYDRFSSRIVYESNVTGEVVEVPSIWYNQPVLARVEAALFYADRDEEHAKRLESDGKPWSHGDAEFYRRQATRLRDNAVRMLETGRVVC